LSAGRVESKSARIGTQREYETVTVLRPETNKAEIGELIRRMMKVIDERSGRLVKIDSWGIRVLAFPVRHCRKGIYLYWRYLGGSDMVAEFERHMRLVDKVVRFYTVRVDDDVDPDARPTEITEELLDAASEPGPDPDELARRAAEEAAARRAAEEEARQAAAAERAKEERNDGGDDDSNGPDGEGED
jgi:small subunit ribosomal protein S6